jgi:hypothetical protein
MKSKQQSPIWPYLGILACLFVLSITAPRAWDRMARQETLSQMLSSRTARPAAARRTQESEHFEKIDAAEFKSREGIGDRSHSKQQPAQQSGAMDDRVTSVNSPALEQQVVPPAPEFAQEVQSPLEAARSPSTPVPDPMTDVPADEPPPQPDYEAAVASSTWPLPRVLLEQLTGVLKADPTAAWAEQAIPLIRELCEPGGRSPAEVISQLRALPGRTTASPGANAALVAQIARCQYALARWLDIWEAAAAWDKIPQTSVVPTTPPDRILACLSAVDVLTRKRGQRAAWREYLQLDTLHRLASAATDQTVDERRAAARKVLDRMTCGQLTGSQRKFLNEGPLATLQRELRCWAAEPVASARLLAHLEQYERTGLPSDAQLVANDWRGLSWSAPAEAERISQHLETHYGNANVRVAVSTGLLNRMVPQPKKMEAQVRDTVLNVPTFGRSTTDAKLVVRTVPDAHRIRVGLEARGLVSSDTVSTSGPATFRNAGQSTFLVRKLIVIGPQGMTIWPAVAEAENNYSSLVSLETDYDGVPLVGSLVRNIARSQHDEKLGQARSEVEQKVAVRALDQFDAEVRPHLVKAAENIQNKQAAMFERLGLEFVPVGMSTAEDRVVARLRVASPKQLGAHTPRPRAPSDSWLSLQLHQSAVNNGLEGLDLSGREFALPELFAWIAKKLDRPQPDQDDDLPKGVHVKFAPQDPVRLRCENEHIEVTISFSELTQGSYRWRNFSVRTFYRPEAKQLDPCFVRDSTIFLEGKGLRNSVMLRTIFSKVFSRKRDISLLDEKFTHDPRLKGLDVSQFVVEDGWIGLAYSPRRTPNNVARKPK